LSTPAARFSTTREPTPSPEPQANLVRLPPPRFCLYDSLGQGALGPTWTAGLADGTPVVVKRLARLSKAAARALAERPSPAGGAHLVPQTAVLQGNEAWVVTERRQEVPLDQLPARLNRSLVVVIGLRILSGLARLHHDGLWHGSLKPGNVLIGLDGSVRLTHYALTGVHGERESAAARLADVRAAGTILCGLMGITVEGPRSRSRAAQSALGAAVRTLAAMGRQKRPGYEATQASVLLWEAAGRLGSVRSQARTAVQLGDMAAAASRETNLAVLRRAPAPAVPTPEPAPPTRARPVRAASPAPVAIEAGPAPPAAAQTRRPRRGAGLALVAGLVLAAAIGALLSPLPRPAAIASTPADIQAAVDFPAASADLQPPRERQVAPPAPSTPNRQAAPALPAPPAPPASGAVRSVTLTALNPCLPGQRCQLEVKVGLVPADRARDVTWQLETGDGCHGGLQVIASGILHAQARWNLVIGYAAVAIPSTGAAILEAVVVSPDGAASEFLRLASGSC
jgi:hypothetical protein